MECTINGKKALFLLDSGSGMSIIDINQIDYYNLRSRPEFGKRLISGIGSSEQIEYLSGVKLEIKGRHFKPIFYGSNLQNVNHAFRKNNIRIAGILGSDFLKQYGAIINYQQSMITLL